MTDDHGKLDDAATPRPKRAYRAPELTEYGSIEDLVDTGIVTNGTVPSISKGILIPLLGR